MREVPEVDILVNNAGIFEPKPFEEIPDDDWLRFFEVNVMSGVRLARAYLPGMRARDWGRVVFVSSESAVQIPVEMIHYGMTKTAQLAIARGLAESHGRNRRDGEQRAARPDRFGGREHVRRARWPRAAASTSRRWSASSSPPRGRPRCSSGSKRPRRWPR